MNTIIDLFRNLWNAMGCVGELLGYVLRFVSAFFQTRASLAARLVAAESQLGICKRRTEQGKVVAKAYLGGLHHCYTRVA
jgi:hypothetical protein